MIVREVGADDGEAWDAYLRTHDGALVYGSSPFRGLLVDLLDCRDRSLAAFEGAEITGVLPLLEKEVDGRRVLNSLPYYGSNGGVLARDAVAAADLVSAYERVIEGASAATIVENPFAPGSVPNVRATHSDERIAQWSELPAADVEPSALRNVRKAERAGYEVSLAADALGELHALHDEGIRAVGGLPKERRFFDLVSARLEHGRDFALYVARRSGIVGAALLVLYFHRTAEYYVPASCFAERSLQPLAPILYRALADAAERGFTRWNWGGTWRSQTGVLRFKRKWGARETVYRYSTQVNDPSLLRARPVELLRRFPGFFVVPFNALERA